jgi:hypothetical protein
MISGALVGLRFATSYFECTDPECRARMASELPTCPGCGGTIAETIAHANLRLERLEELQRDCGARRRARVMVRSG